MKYVDMGFTYPVANRYEKGDKIVRILNFFSAALLLAAVAWYPLLWAIYLMKA